MLLDVDAKEVGHEHEMRPILAELFGFLELFVVDEDFDGFVIHLLLDKQDNLLLEQPGVLNDLEQLLGVVVVLFF